MTLAVVRVVDNTVTVSVEGASLLSPLVTAAAGYAAAAEASADAAAADAIATAADAVATGMLVGSDTEAEGYLYAIKDTNRRLLVGITNAGDVEFPAFDEVTEELDSAAGSAVDLPTRLDAGLSPEGLPKALYANERFLRDWRYKSIGAQLGTGLVSLALVGDSWTYYQETARNYAEKLATLLQTAFGNGGPGFVSMGKVGGTVNSRAAGGGATVGFAGTWADSPAWAGRGPDLSEATSSTVASTITATVTATNLTATKLLYLKKSGGGEFRYRFDAGSWTTVNTANASDALGEVDLVPPVAAHTLTIEVVSAGTTGVTIFGANMTKATGAVVHRLSTSGSTTTQWAVTQAVRDAGWTALNPDALQIMLGTNDQGVNLATATYKSNLANLITRRRAGRANADIVLVSVPENLDGRATPMTAYRDAVRAAALENDAVFVDLLTAFGETVAEYNTASPRQFITTADLLHPQANGFAEITAVLANLYLYRN